MPSETIRFESVTWPVAKTVPCRGGCGRKLRRSTTLAQTINPWNKNAEGQPKSQQEILAELRAEAEAWHPRNDVCTHCDGA